MLFYEDLIKQLEKNKDEEINLKKIEKFSLNSNKTIIGYGIALPLIAVGLYQIYSYTVYKKWFLLILGMIFLGLGLKQFKNIFTYSVLIDTEIGKIKSGKLDMLLSNVKSLMLKEMKAGKKFVPVIDMITLDRKQVIIPLYMRDQIRFISVLRKILGNKFNIQK
ncbi:hypothetical protein [Fusobacterium russii]|uniref:hypothetical protein n=1 Tax=Fusobacterium russii TaxID=854 RepID=UPI00039CB68E|nr:hypothetical protein [Fusobacterium russii]